MGLHSFNEPFIALLTQGMINKAHPYCEQCEKFLPLSYDKDGNWTGDYDPEKGICNTCGAKYILKSAKMSKSLGNIESPIDNIKKFGADTTRFFIMHGANPEKGMDWSDAGIESDNKVLLKIWELITEELEDFRETSDVYDNYILFRLHRMIMRVTETYDKMLIRDALNEIINFTDLLREYKTKKPNRNLYMECREKLVLMLAPVIPHICEEMWEYMSKEGFVSLESWPKYDEKYISGDIELQWMCYDNVIEDVINIQKLINIETISEIQIIVASDWKNDFVNTVLNLIKEGKQFGEIMKAAMQNNEWKKYGKIIKGFIQKLSKNPGKLTPPFKDQEEEYKFFSQNAKMLEREFKANVKVVHESEAKDNKKNQALPGKPALIIK